MLKNLCFLRGFGLQEGARGGKNGILRSFQHRWPKHGPNIAPKRAQHGPNLGQYRPKMGPTWLNMGPTWPNMGTTCVQHRPRLLPYRQALRIMPASVLHIALPGFARRISAQSSHTIRQTSLLGRRPAVKRKPLHKIAISPIFSGRPEAGAPER